MKALFKHLSPISQGEPGSVVNKTFLPNKYFQHATVSSTLLAVFLGVPQIPIIGSGKAVAQNACPVGTAPATVQLDPSDNLQDLTQEYNIGGIRTVFTFSEEVPGQVIDRTESRVDTEIYGGIQGPDLRLNIGPGKPPETGNLAPGSATVTITFAQPITFASSATLLDVDRDGARDNNRTFQDVVTVTASNNNANVPVTLQALGPFTRIQGNTAFGQVENSRPQNGDGNVSITPTGAIDQLRIQYIPGTEFGERGQDQTIGLAPFTICAPTQTGTIGDTVYRDTNGNGTQDPGEEGIGGVNLTVTGAGPDAQFGTSDDTTATTTTDNNGLYSFPNLLGGNYRVTVNNPPEGLNPTQTPPETIVLEVGQNFDTADFGFSPQQLGSIGDTVYTDGNRNNVQDENELGIPGATVTLTNLGPDGQLGTADDTTQTTTTNEQGIYGFTNLPPGTYRVTATSPRNGDTPTQTQPNNIQLQGGQNLDTVDFGFAPQTVGTGQSSIGDTVYNDTNANNQQDPGETGIPNTTVTLTNPGPDGVFGTPDDTTQTTTTDENGIYGFNGLTGGNYRVVATTPDGLTPTQTPPDTIPLGENQNLNTIDFGFAPSQGNTGSIGDTVYNDTNRNNQQDTGETGIPGATVTLTGSGSDGQLGTADDTTQTTTTDSNGIYGFTNLPPGNYRVSTTTPDGLSPTQTQPDIINLQSNQNIDTIDFGFAPSQEGVGSIGDTVYNDINGNGQQDPGEPGIPGVTVNYTGTGPDGVFGGPQDDDITSSTTTDANGNYTFADLPTGTYRVTINDQSQEPIRGLSQTQIPNNPIQLNAGDNITDADFGFTQPTGIIGDTVYRDNNGDGTQNQGEPGISGVQVTLTGPGPDGQLGTPDDTTQTTTTNENGNYSFADVPLGNYRVTVENPPEGLNPTQTPPNPVSLTEPGQNFDTADFGFSPQQVGTIGDFVFFDNDGDSTPDGDESGIPGITLILRDNDGNEVATTTTDENGFYNFVVPPGTYTVTVANPPEGLNPTLTQPNPITLEAGENIDTVDFGFQPSLQGSIGDTVFADENGNGTQDPGEPGVSGVLVRLIRPGDDGVFGTPDDEVTEQRTDNAQTVTSNENTPGLYTFDNLPPGNYQVEIVLPDGNVLTTGANPISVNLEPNQNIDSVDFGIRESGFGGDNPGSIGDEVFDDRNRNGVRDDGEPGIPNVTLTLTQPGPDGELGTSDDTTTTTTTNDQGIYNFGNLPSGPYRVTVTPPLGFPDVTNPSGQEIETNLQPGQTLNNVDFGLSSPEGGSIGDTVFVDQNGNGVQDFTDSNNNGIKDPNESGDPGIPGIQVTLRDSNNNVVATTTTDENGNYIFNGLPLGNFTVESATPSDFSPTNGTTTNGITTLTAELTEGNSDRRDIDFGFRPGLLGAGPGNFPLVKRITNALRANQVIPGIAFNQFEDDPNDSNDNIVNASPLVSVAGLTNLETPVFSGDIIEYTIYFAAQGASLNGARICDLIPDGTTFVDGSISIVIRGGSTGADNGTFVQPLAPVQNDFQNICNTTTATNGAVITNLGNLVNGQAGFVRFQVRVD